MKYFEVTFHISAPEGLHEAACDVMIAQAGDAGFESFVETDDGFRAYVQQSLFQPFVLGDLLNQLPFDDMTASYELKEAEDCDWNAQWEEEGFEPIVVDSRCVVHDGRHLNDIELTNYPYAIEIDAHLAFGTGNHETTRMMIASLLDQDMKGLRVLDCGSGTGILGIVALKAGAAEAVGYDIDEWSVSNSQHNAIINDVDDRYTSLMGDVQVLQTIKGTFDIVMANINRNILLADMDAFSSKLNEHGSLILSGFYTDDTPLLEKKAATLGLHLVNQRQEGDWACLTFTKIT